MFIIGELFAELMKAEYESPQQAERQAWKMLAVFLIGTGMIVLACDGIAWYFGIEVTASMIYFSIGMIVVGMLPLWRYRRMRES